MTEPLLACEGLVVDYGRGGRGPRVRAVDGVDLTLARGETLAVVGESGSGKSTLARALLRLLEPRAGRIRFDGRTVFDADHPRSAVGAGELRRLRRRMPIVLQNPALALDPRLSVGDAVGEGLRAHGLARASDLERRVVAALELVGLGADVVPRWPHELSGGQRQRVALARALVLEPDLIVLDEPTSALDVAVQARIIGLLDDLKRRLGLAYLFVSHDLGLVERLADRVAVLFRGRIVEIGSVRDLYAGPRHPYTRSLLAAGEGARAWVADGASAAADPGTGANVVGCPYHPRCDVAIERCARESPELRPPAAGHRARCHVAEEEDTERSTAPRSGASETDGRTAT